VEREDNDPGDRARLLDLLARRYSQRPAVVRPVLNWKDPVEWARLKLAENGANSLAISADARWDYLTRCTGSTVRALMTTRLASERGGVLHLTLSKRLLCESYVELMGLRTAIPRWRFNSSHVVGPGDVEPLRPGQLPRGDALFISPADMYRNPGTRGRKFDALVADHVVVDVIFANSKIWMPSALERRENEPLWSSLASIESRACVIDAVGRRWEPGMSFTLPGQAPVGLITDTICYVNIVIGLAALYEGRPVSLCPEMCVLLEPRD
jgi:hypothetical protein